MNKKGRMNKEEKYSEQMKYLAKKLLDKCAETKYKRIGVLTSIILDEKKDEIISALGRLCKGIELKGLPSIEKTVQVLEELESCDAIVLIEKYGTTTYRGFEEMLSVISKQKKEVIGLITYR